MLSLPHLTALFESVILAWWNSLVAGRLRRGQMSRCCQELRGTDEHTRTHTHTHTHAHCPQNENKHRRIEARLHQTRLEILFAKVSKRKKLSESFSVFAISNALNIAKEKETFWFDQWHCWVCNAEFALWTSVHCTPVNVVNVTGIGQTRETHRSRIVMKLRTQVINYMVGLIAGVVLRYNVSNALDSGEHSVWWGAVAYSSG